MSSIAALFPYGFTVVGDVGSGGLMGVLGEVGLGGKVGGVPGRDELRGMLPSAGI